MSIERGTFVWNVGSSSVKGMLQVGVTVRFRWQADLQAQQLHFSDTKKIVRVGSLEQVVSAVAEHLPKDVVIGRVIHRIVYGGPTQWKPTKVNSAVLHTLRRYSDRDPLHLPAALSVYAQVHSTWPTAQNWFVFDSGIYQHIPPMVREYALPRWVVEKYHIRRLGFHGISHWWAAMSSAHSVKKSFQHWSGITVHLGSGSSVTAWKNGRPIDTSMGFSPLSVPMMATQVGDLDPLLPLFLVRQAGMTPKRVEHLLNEESGFRGMTGSPDMRDALSALGHHQVGWPKPQRVHKVDADIAMKMFTYEVAKYIGSYRSILPSGSSVIFTGAIGENRRVQRQILGWLHAEHRPDTRTVHADEERAMVAILDDVIY